MGEECAVCGAEAPQRCSGCGIARYCSRDHQRKHWDQHRLQCRPFKIASDAVLGRHLKATRDLRAGELVLREAPLAAGPGPASPAVCLGCLEPLQPDAVVECRRCGWPLCGADACMTSPAHRPECDVVAQWRGEPVRIRDVGAPSHPMYAWVLALRALWLREGAPARWERLWALESHCALRKAAPRWEADRAAADHLLRGFFGAGARFSEDELMRLCGIIQVNGHEVPLVEPAYVAVYDLASLLEHSCRPNCSKSFSEGGDILIHAALPIKRGDHISICYTDALWGTANRRHHLHGTKFFWCRCERCADPTEFGTYFSALKCLTEGCGGAAVPRRPLAPPGSPPQDEEDLDAMRWACVECTRPLPAADVFRALNEAGSALAGLQRGDAGECEAFLARWGGAASPLAPNHFYLTEARLALAQLLGGDAGLAQLPDAQLRLKEQLCKQLIALCDKLVPAEQRVRGLLRFELHAALAEAARRHGVHGGADPARLRAALLESKRLLEESLQLLQYEPHCLPEGQMALQAQRNLLDLQNLLQEVHAAAGGDSPL